MEDNTDIVVRVSNFSFQYNETRRRALRDLDLEVRKGSFLCVVGPNGAGKSTLCNALVGLIPHYFVGKSRGSVQIKGQDVTRTSVAELSKTIGLVFQNPFNQLSYTAETVAEELAFGLGNNGVSRAEMERRVAEVAKTVRVEGILERNPLELSGGQVQRVAFGSAFIMRPEILVLDECTTQLDPLGSEELIDIVKALNDEGVTVIMADHDMERVARCADKVVVMRAGRIVAFDTPDVIFTDPGLETWGIEPPEYVAITSQLRELGLSDGPIAMTEGPAVQAVREALQ